MYSTDDLTSCAIIDLDAVEHNVRSLVHHIGAKVVLIAVVKANAYGHGAQQIARVALESGAKRLAVARLQEGAALRRAGISAPILVMGYALPDELRAAVDYDLTATINTMDGARAVSRSATSEGKQATIHVKVDTGMGRYGLLPSEVVPFLQSISGLPNLLVEGIYTHFAAADEREKTFTKQQFEHFQQVLKAVSEAGFTIPLKHAANSAATIDLPETHLDAVRCGVALYGMYPSPEVSRAVSLTPALTLTSHVARVRTLPVGSSVGYGRTFVARQPTQVALIPIGYGDGYRRNLSNKGVVLIHGHRAPIIGQVSMDQITVDVSRIEAVNQDDPVILIGRQEDDAITADELADLAGTIHYDITTSLLPRAPRVYVRHGQVVESVS